MSGHFDQLAPAYSRLRSESMRHSPLVTRLVEAADLSGRRLLDVGCGPGDLLAALAADYGVDAHGADASPAMVAEAARKIGDDRVVVAQAEALPFEDGSFERVTMQMVVHHLDRPRAFDEARRVLASGGRTAIVNTDPAGVADFWLADYFPTYVEVERARFPQGDVVAAELRSAGFRESRWERWRIERRFDRATALAKLRGRAYSTFEHLSDEEYETGVRAAERRLPDEVVYDLTLFIATAQNPSRVVGQDA